MGETAKIVRSLGEYEFGEGRKLVKDIYDVCFELDAVLNKEENLNDPLGSVCRWLAENGVPGATRSEADDFACTVRAEAERLKKNTLERHGLPSPTD